MGVQPVYDKGPHPLLRTGTQAARGKTSGISYRLNYCVIFIVNNLQMWPRVAQYNLAGRRLETHGLGAATRSVRNDTSQCNNWHPIPIKPSRPEQQ